MRLLSWNIQWGRGADGKVDLARTIAAIRRAGEPDVICLQELACNFPGLPGGVRDDGLARLSAAFPDHVPVFGAGLDVADGEGGRAQFGNLVLSRLPVGQVLRHLLPAPADDSVPSMQRVCVEAVIEAQWGPLRVMTTHLEYYSAGQRMAQVEALRALQVAAFEQAQRPPRIKTSNPSFAFGARPRAAILCGDFNFEPDSAEYRRMLADMGPGQLNWRDAWQLARADEAHAPTVGLHGAEWPDRAYCCDFVFVTADLGPRLRAIEVVSDTAASDHQPVVVDMND